MSLHPPRARAPSTPFDQTPTRTPSPSHSAHFTPCSIRARSPTQAEELWNVLNLDVANLAVRLEAFNPADIHSPNDIMETEEHIVEPTANGAEKDNLTIINPDNLETEAEQLQDLTRADDCTFPLRGNAMATLGGRRARC